MASTGQGGPMSTRPRPPLRTPPAWTEHTDRIPDVCGPLTRGTPPWHTLYPIPGIPPNRSRAHGPATPSAGSQEETGPRSSQQAHHRFGANRPLRILAEHLPRGFPVTGHGLAGRSRWTRRSSGLEPQRELPGGERERIFSEEETGQVRGGHLPCVDMGLPRVWAQGNPERSTPGPASPGSGLPPPGPPPPPARHIPSAPRCG